MMADIWANAPYAPTEPDPHADCPSWALQQVTCDRCKRTFQCTPHDDFYCSADGDHCCEGCLLGGLRLVAVAVDDTGMPEPCQPIGCDNGYHLPGCTYAAVDEPVPFSTDAGPVPGYVAGHCGHRVAESEWRAGFRVCERCPDAEAGAAS